MRLTKEQRFGILSSLIFLLGFTGILLIFGFSTPLPLPGEEGILINFGTDEYGSGQIEPKPSEQPVQQESVSQPVNVPEPQSSNNTEEEVVTQNFEDAASVEEKKRIQEEAEVRKKIEEGKERKRLEEDEIKRKAKEEQNRKDEQQKAINNRAKNAFGGKNKNGDNLGEGDSDQSGNQGNPQGDINSKNRTGGLGGGNGISFSLSGRKSQSLPKPEYKSQSQGKVVVEVNVDQNGNVVSARAGVKGTTTTNEVLYNSAKKAALKAKFNVKKDAPALQKGTITYHFMLQ